MSDLKFRVNASRKAEVFVRELRAGIGRSTPKAAEQAGRLIVREIGKQIRGWAEAPTGRLEQSFDVLVRRGSGRDATTEMRVTSGLVYALIHERGGIIRAKKRDRRGRRLLYLQRNGRIFAVVPQVRIRRKRYITRAMAVARPEVAAIFGRVVTSASREAARRAAR